MFMLLMLAEWMAYMLYFVSMVNVRNINPGPRPSYHTCPPPPKRRPQLGDSIKSIGFGLLKHEHNTLKVANIAWSIVLNISVDIPSSITS